MAPSATIYAHPYGGPTPVTTWYVHVGFNVGMSDVDMDGEDIQSWLITSSGGNGSNGSPPSDLVNAVNQEFATTGAKTITLHFYTGPSFTGTEFIAAELEITIVQGPTGTISLDPSTVAPGGSSDIVLDSYDDHGVAIDSYQTPNGDFAENPTEGMTLDTLDTSSIFVDPGEYEVAIAVSTDMFATITIPLAVATLTISEGGDPDPDPGGGEGVGCRWVLYDPVLDEQYTFTVNPQETSAPKRTRNFSSASTTSGRGKPIVQEGAFQPAMMEFSGLIYDQATFDTLTDYSRRKYLLLLTDDLGVARYILIQSFKAERVRALAKQSGWKHSYTMSVQVVEVDG